MADGKLTRTVKSDSRILVNFSTFSAVYIGKKLWAPSVVSLLSLIIWILDRVSTNSRQSTLGRNPDSEH
jgi:hypothetical protein